MKMALDSATGLHLVAAYTPGLVTLNTRQSFEQSIIVFPDKLHTDWGVVSVEEIRPKDYAPIFEYKPELLIIGTGDTQIFPHPRTFIDLIDMNIGYEIMDNSAACRTFNILMGEGRKASLALIMPQ